MASLRSLSTCTTASSHGGWRGGPLESTPRGDNNDRFDEVGDLGGARKEGYDDDEYFNGETMRHARQYALDRDQRTWEENRLLSSGALMRTEVDLDFNGGKARFSVIREAVDCPVRNGNRGYVRPSVCDSHIGRRRRKRGGRKERARKERRLHPPSVPSSPTKTVRVRPTPRPNLRDSSDESEGGLMEAFHEKRARDEGLAVGAEMVGMDDELAVGAAMVGMDDGLTEPTAQGGPSNEPSNEPINLDEQFFIDQHNDLCEVCNQPGFLLCCEKCNLVFHMPCVGLQVEPEVFLCTYCLADDNPSERQPSEYELKRLRRIENEDDVDDDEDNEDDEDDVNDEDVGTFRNEVEGGVPCAPHSTFIKRLHYLNQTPSYRRSVIENNEIIQLIKKLNQMKSRGEIGGKPCGLKTSWTFKKNECEKHSIGKIVGVNNSFKVFPKIICSGDTPSLGEVITAIKQTNGTKIGKEVSIMEVPVDVLEYCRFVPIAKNAKAFITSRFESIFALKNKNGEMEMYHNNGNSTSGKRRNITFPQRMFVDEKKKKLMQRGRFGLLCFSVNRNQSDWEICECDHMNGDPTDDRNENARWLTRKENRANYHNNRNKRTRAT